MGGQSARASYVQRLLAPAVVRRIVGTDEIEMMPASSARDRPQNQAVEREKCFRCGASKGL
jgi:hypothetical protein